MRVNKRQRCATTHCCWFLCAFSLRFHWSAWGCVVFGIRTSNYQLSPSTFNLLTNTDLQPCLRLRRHRIATFSMNFTNCTQPHPLWSDTHAHNTTHTALTHSTGRSCCVCARSRLTAERTCPTRDEPAVRGGTERWRRCRLTRVSAATSRRWRSATKTTVRASRRRCPTSSQRWRRCVC